MLDQATLEMTKGVDMAVLRRKFRNNFATNHSPLAPEEFHQLGQHHKQALALFLCNHLFDEVQDALKDRLIEIRQSILSDYDNELFEALIKSALVDHGNNTIIWTSLFAIFPRSKELSPPQSSVALSASIHTPRRASAVKSTCTATPLSYSSASHQGSEQTKADLKDILIREIQSHIYRTAKGFDEKYFQNKEWSSRAQTVYQAMKTRYIDQNWAGLDTAASQLDVLQWLFSMQDDFLSKEDCRYYSIESLRELIGGEAPRQIDIILKRKNGDALDMEHNWKDIRIIGELKASISEGFKDPLLQLARYARDIFASQPTRRYLHAFLLRGCQMETFIFDRSGCYSPGQFNIHKFPERFIRTLAGYIMMNEDDLGLDTFLQKDNDSSFITLEGPSGGMTKFQLDSKPLSRQRAIVSRATTVFLTKYPSSDSWDCVTKLSWPPNKRHAETDLLKFANQRGAQGVPQLLGYCDITSVDKLRSGIAFGRPYVLQKQNGSGQTRKRKSDVSIAPSAKRSKSESEQSGLQGAMSSFEETTSQDRLGPPMSKYKYNKRIFRCIVTSPAGRPIYEFESPLELITAIRDAIKAHESLFTIGKILHRDISENNIIIVDPKKNKSSFLGMLIDLDLALDLGQALDPEHVSSGAPCRTGTMEFMAMGVLKSAKHTYRHDLESFLYVLLWQCVCGGFQRGQGRENENNVLTLKKWYRGSFDDIFEAKFAAMHSRFFNETVLVHFRKEFDILKPLCKELRSILFRENIYLDTPPNPDDLYRPIIAAFDKAIREVGSSPSAAVDPAEP